jgi:hypothetical protein
MSCEYEESVDSCGGGTSEEWPSHEVLVFKMLLTPTGAMSILSIRQSYHFYHSSSTNTRVFKKVSYVSILSHRT